MINPFNYTQIDHLIPSIKRYANDGIPMGGFLTACFANDFMGACGRADSQNLELMPVIAAYIYNEVPSNCHGSYEIVEQWTDMEWLDV